MTVTYKTKVGSQDFDDDNFDDGKFLINSS